VFGEGVRPTLESRIGANVAKYSFSLFSRSMIRFRGSKCAQWKVRLRGKKQI
jgi:hypothetical protein